MDNIDKIKSILGDNADEKISSVLSALGSGGGSDKLSGTDTNHTGGDIETLMQIKGLVDELGLNANDSRSALLASLKPYLRASRQRSIDSAIKLLNLSKLSGIFRLR